MTVLDILGLITLGFIFISLLTIQLMHISEFYVIVSNLFYKIGLNLAAIWFLLKILDCYKVISI